MENTPKGLSQLKRNLYGTILLAILLPIYISKGMNEDPTVVSIGAAVVIAISAINLSYTNRIEKELRKNPNR